MNSTDTKYNQPLRRDDPRSKLEVRFAESLPHQSTDVKTEDVIPIPAYELDSTTQTGDIYSFEYVSKLIQECIEDPDSVDDREALVLYNPIAKFATLGLAYEAFEDGFRFLDLDDNPITDESVYVSGKDEKGKPKEELIGPKALQLKKDLDMILYDKETDIAEEITAEKLKHGTGIVLVHFVRKTEDSVKIEKEYYKNLKEKAPTGKHIVPYKLEVFGPMGSGVYKKDGFKVKEYDTNGNIKIVEITIQNVNLGGNVFSSKPFDVHVSRCLFIRGPKKDRTHVGHNNLSAVFSSIINWEWNSFALTDYANKRGSVLIMRNSQPVNDTILDKQTRVLQRIQSRGRMALAKGREVDVIPAQNAPVDIPSALDKNLEGVSPGIKVPVMMLKGSQPGQLSSSQNDQLRYYPTLRKCQLDFQKQILMELIRIMRPDLLGKFKIEFNMKFNLSDTEKATLKNTQEDGLAKEIDKYVMLWYSIGEICEKVGLEPPKGIVCSLCGHIWIPEGEKVGACPRCDDTEGVMPLTELVPLKFEKEMAEIQNQPLMLPPKPPEGEIKKAQCPECGYKWLPKNGENTCPKCGAPIKQPKEEPIENSTDSIEDPVLAMYDVFNSVGSPRNISVNQFCKIMGMGTETFYRRKGKLEEVVKNRK